MAKTYTEQTIVGDGGVALIHLRVTKMGFAWHPRSLDVGIDGEIELRDPPTGNALNKVLFVQSKASTQPFPGEDDRGFHYLCKPRDIDYWMQADVPVLLVCSHPATEEAWWVNVTEWFADPRRRISRRVDFDKVHDRFDRSAAPLLLQHGAATHVSALLPRADGEVLTSNLLPVRTFPAWIYVAPASVGTIDQARHRMKAHHRYGSDWLLLDKSIYSFTDLREPPYDVLCEPSVETLGSHEWAGSDDPDVRYRFVRMLNQLFREIHHRDLTWHGKHKFHYFRANEDLSDRKASTPSGRTRTVVTSYAHPNDSTQITHYRHYAVRTRFLIVDARWHLAIRPDYHYTRDGYRDSRWADEKRAGIKRRERNPAVRHLVRFWAHYLAPPATLLTASDSRLVLDPLADVEADVGFDDPAPTTGQRTTAAEPADHDDTPRLFPLP